MNRSFALLALIVIGVGFGGLGFALYDRFNSGRHTRVAICLRINAVKKILRDEHETKMLRFQKFLQEHPNGIDGIPRELILQGIEDEKAIIGAVRPDRCR